jgi:hypothetical protein
MNARFLPALRSFNERVCSAKWRGLKLLLLAALWAAAPAWAHKPSDSYLRLNGLSQGPIEGQWDIALRDLEEAIGLDADGDGAITWGELRQRHADIAAYALARLKVSRNGLPCVAKAGEQLVDEHSDGAYTVLPFTLECAAPAATAADAAAAAASAAAASSAVHGASGAAPEGSATLTVDYKLFAELDPLHRGLLKLSSGTATQTAVLDPGGKPVRFELKSPNRLSQFIDYLREGVWHIWIGFDHILFLLSLLLPAVLVWSAPARQWKPVARFKDALVDVLKIVTAFTLAHSITLSLATLGFVSLPSAWVEATIAASVVLAALNNVWPLFQGRRWAMAFGFGLIHGFGFASVLTELGLPSDALLLALVAFNVGVELGQLAIVAVFLPVAFAIRRLPLYHRWLLTGGSLLIAALAAVWFAERAFDMKLMPSLG